MLRGKTYIINMARGNRRTDYVAVSNTVFGVKLMLLVCRLIGFTTGASLPEVE